MISIHVHLENIAVYAELSMIRFFAPTLAVVNPDTEAALTATSYQK